MYDGSQKRLIAYELARCGLHVPNAVKNLRDQYETFRGIGETTIRRLMQNVKFCELVAERAAIVREEHDASVREAERARTRQDLEGSMLGELRADDRLLEESRKRLDEVLRDESRVSPAMAVRAFGLLAKLIDQRRARALPAVANTRQMSLLITIFAEESQSMFGADKARDFRNRVRERYVREIEATSAETEPAAAN